MSIGRRIAWVLVTTVTIGALLYGVREAYFYFFVFRPGVAKMLAAAEQGDLAMQTELGMMYQEGGLPKRISDSSTHIVATRADPANALFWFRKAAEQNYAEAEWWLSLLIASGRAVPRDDTQVVYWMQRSAEHGSDTGEWMLGRMYEKGYNGVQRDRLKALEWYQKAAAQGNSQAIESIRALNSPQNESGRD